jgi:hypothetical protein
MHVQKELKMYLTNKKRCYLSSTVQYFTCAILIMLCLTPKQAVSDRITNKTPYKAWVGVHYKVCKDDHLVIPPEETHTFNPGWCIREKIAGVLAPEPGNFSKNIAIQELKNISASSSLFEIVSDVNGGYKIHDATPRGRD